MQNLYTKTTESSSIIPAVKELERIFQECRPLFGQDLPMAVITIQSHGGRSNLLGWFCPEAWSAKDDSARPEINIVAEHLSRGVENIAETMVHEMVHYANALSGTVDCGRSGYHKLAFRDLCREVGLTCERIANRGWSGTGLTEELRRFIQNLEIAEQPFNVFRSLSRSGGGKGSRLIKWSCGCTNVRVAIQDFCARCEKCGRKFAKTK